MQPALDHPTNAAPTLPIRVAVDLSNLRPGGENGGIKPFLFETLRWLGRQQRVPLRFFFLTAARTHVDVREELARIDDELLCVRDDGGPLPCGGERAPRERRCVPPPADMLSRLGVRVLYCPFGAVEFAEPGICTISTVVDVLHRDFPWSLDPHHAAERERVFQAMIAVADALQCNSEYVIGRMREHYGVAPGRMFKVYNAVHQRFATAIPAEGNARSANGRGVGKRLAKPFFFYPANAWKHKNHETLLLAYGMYRAGAMAVGREPWPLVLTGHEDERWAAMRALAQTLGLLGNDAVRFAGYVPAEAFGWMWDAAGALVFPSLHEGFGIPLLEAMQHSVPILCSRDGSLPEVGADACLFVDARRPEALAEAMTHLASDDALRERLIEAGRRRLVHFSQDREAGRLLDVIVSLAQRRPPYRPCVSGIFPDGWTEQTALLALPSAGSGTPIPGRLTLRFNPMPAPRRLRLRVGDFVALGGFDLPAHRPADEISVDLQADGGFLRMEVPDAENLSPDDGRIHGVRLLAADLRLANGEDFPLFRAR